MKNIACGQKSVYKWLTQIKQFKVIQMVFSGKGILFLCSKKNSKKADTRTSSVKSGASKNLDSEELPLFA